MIGEVIWLSPGLNQYYIPTRQRWKLKPSTMYWLSAMYPKRSTKQPTAFTRSQHGSDRWEASSGLGPKGLYIHTYIPNTC